VSFTAAHERPFIVHRVVPGALQRTKVPGAAEILATWLGAAQAAAQPSGNPLNSNRRRKPTIFNASLWSTSLQNIWWL
jgi:hypothetical protein